jgi:hypothetical protein
MKILINGMESGLINYNVGGDQTMELLFLDDDGAPLDFSSDTGSVEVYASATRTLTLASKAVSGGTPASGTGQVVLADTEANWVDLNPGQQYNFRAKIIAAGGDVSLSTNNLRLNVI